jgi:hypothetical protein
MTTWHSISISIPGQGIIFTGFFSVNTLNNNLVTSFYETINGSTDFNNNILGVSGDTLIFNADNEFSNNNFTYNGTNINYMNYYIDQPTYNVFNLAFVNPSPPTWTITFLTVNGFAVSVAGEQNATFTIQTISDPSCFNEGTKILCLNKDFVEEYRPIENLRKGDLVKSYKHGYRKIDLIGKNPMFNNPNVWDKCMYKMEKSDLIVTGGHAILVDTIDSPEQEENNNRLGNPIQIDDKQLLLASVSKDFVKLEDTNLYIYYHFILENNGDDEERFGVWANGILTETPSKTNFNNHNYTLI